MKKNHLLPLILAATFLVGCDGTSLPTIPTSDPGSSTTSEPASNPTNEPTSTPTSESSQTAFEQRQGEMTGSFKINCKVAENQEITDLGSSISSTDFEIKSMSGTSIFSLGDGGLRIGKSKGTGNIKITLAQKYVIKNVTVTGQAYNSDQTKLKVVTGANTTGYTKSFISYGDYSFDFDEQAETDNFTIATIENKKRANVYGISLTVAIKDPVFPTAITLSPSSMELAPAASSNLSVTYAPSNVNYKKVTYTTGDATVATVDESGKVKATATAAVGSSTTITATAEAVNGTISATSTVTIVEAPKLTKTDIAIDYEHYDEYQGIGFCPSKGEPNILVLPVWFTNSSNFITNATNKANVLSDIRTAFFGTSAQTGWESVNSFYAKESSGLCDIKGTVADWIDAGVPYTDLASDDDYGTATAEFVLDLVDDYFTSVGNDKRKNYDTDGDGFLDSVFVVYAAPDCQALGNDEYDNLWAYTTWDWTGTQQSTANPGVSTWLWASYDFMYTSAKANSRAGSTYSNAAGDYMNIDAHTYIHEFGHALGLDDYYDYNGEHSPAACFSMQDFNIGAHDPYSHMALGWCDPLIPTTSCTVEIGTFEETKDVILLTPEWNEDDSVFDEYLLIELYAPIGLNEKDAKAELEGYPGYTQGPTETGIRLWHVDSRLMGYWVEDDSMYIANEPEWMTNFDNESEYDCIMIGTSNTGGSGLCHNYYEYPYANYPNYDLLHLIRNDSSLDWEAEYTLQDEDLFLDGDSFDMYTFRNQFGYRGKLDSEKALGWEFTVNITGEGAGAKAVINLTKAD